MASPAMDMGVLSIMGLGDGRGVNLCFCFLRSASFSCSHCSAILPQSMAAWLLVLQGHGDKVRCDRKTSLPSLPCCSYKNHEKQRRQDMDTNTRSDSLWLLPLPGAGRWLRLCLGLGGLGCGVGLELVLGRGDGLAGSSVGIAGGHQRGGHRLLCWSREDLQRAEAVRGQRADPARLGGASALPCSPRRVPTLMVCPQPC